MPETNQNNKMPQTTKSNKKRIWLATIIVVLTPLLAYHLLTHQSVEEQLAEIEAARAIPDSKNAAVVYNQLFQQFNINALEPPGLSLDAYASTLYEPWSAENHPKLAKILDGQQATLSRLLEASQIPQCRFPIDGPRLPPSHHETLFPWSILLARAANNDIAKGRTEAALEKYKCMIQIASHRRQQPTVTDMSSASNINRIALINLARFIVEGDATESRLKTIDTTLRPCPRDWEQNWILICRISDLLDERAMSRLPLLERLKWKIDDLRTGGSLRAQFRAGSRRLWHDEYLREMSRHRATQLLIELRRFKNRTGKWPARLNDIASLAPPAVFVDPLNNGSFVYTLARNDLILYSRGKNNIDENGDENREASPILYKTEPAIPKKDDILFWPPKERKIKQKTANTQPSGPNADPRE